MMKTHIFFGAFTAASLQVVSASAVSRQESGLTCVDTTTPNAFINPSWESGTAGWTYNWPMATTNAYSTDGLESITFTGNSFAGARLIEQTVSNLEVGLAYNVSVDLKAVVNPAYALQVSCQFYMFHDAITTSNLITRFSKVYTRADSTWNTYGGTVTPTSSSMMLGWVMACSTTYTSSIFNTYFDNAVMEVISKPSPFSLDERLDHAGVLLDRAHMALSHAPDVTYRATVEVCSAASPTSSLAAASSTLTPVSTSTSDLTSTSSTSGPDSSTMSSTTPPAPLISTAAAVNETSMAPDSSIVLSATPSAPINTTAAVNGTSMAQNATSAAPSIPKTATATPSITLTGSMSLNSSTPVAVVTRPSIPNTAIATPNNTLSSSLSSNSSTAVTVVTRPSIPNTTIATPNITLSGSLSLNSSTAVTIATRPTSLSLLSNASLTVQPTSARYTAVSPSTVASTTSSSATAFYHSSGSTVPTFTRNSSIISQQPSSTGAMATLNTTLTTTPLQPGFPTAQSTIRLEGIQASTTNSSTQAAPSIPISGFLSATRPPPAANTTPPTPISTPTASSILVPAGNSTGNPLAPSSPSSSQAPAAGDALTTLTVHTTSVRTAVIINVPCGPTATDCRAGWNSTSAGPLMTSSARPEGSVLRTVLVTDTIALSTTVGPAAAAASIAASILSAAASGTAASAATVTGERSGGAELDGDGGGGYAGTSGGSTALAAGTEGRGSPAALQTPSPTTLRAVVKKPCDRSR